MINQADVIIVGTGAAGLFCALKLPDNMKIVMITKDQVENSDSFLAQGGICMLRNPADFESYYEDTMKAGHYQNDPQAVSLMIRTSPHIIENLVDYHVDFKQNNGEFAFTKEGAHSTSRILYHDDITGKEITSKLLSQVRKRKNITIYDYTTMIDLICSNDDCLGILAQDKQGEVFNIYANNVVLATGGLGGLFRYTTNYPHITGDALGIAIKQGIHLKNINYIQIHPTTLYSEKAGRSFLISESVRGEGGILLNAKGERFVDELLPRDLLTEAIEK
ncbi:MAG: FAD-binding protein, partial [Eubacterium sp.]